MAAPPVLSPVLPVQSPVHSPVHSRRPVVLRPVIPVLVALLAAALLALPAATGSSSAQAAPADRYASKATSSTNAQRQAHGQRPLRTNRCLVRAARSQARAMARNQTIYHQELRPVLLRCRVSLVGENVAMGYRTGRAVVRGWMGSPGHRANILRREFRLVGVAAERGRDGRWYAAQVFGRR